MLTIFDPDTNERLFQAEAVIEMGYTKTSKVSSFPREAGGAASDHVSMEFPSVRFIVGVSNTPIDGKYSESRLMEARRDLDRVYENGKQVIVAFDGRGWFNLVMRELSETQTADTGFALFPTIMFTQVSTIDQTTERIPAIGEALEAREARHVADEAAEEETDNGNQSGEEPGTVAIALGERFGVFER